MTVSLRDKWLFLDAVMGDSALPGSAKSAAYFLLDHLNTQTERCDPSLIGLAERMGMSRQSAITGIAALIAGGYFERVVGGGRGVRTKYRPCWKTVKQASQYQDTETVKQSIINGKAERTETVKQTCHETGKGNQEETGKGNPSPTESDLPPPDEPSSPPPARNKYAFIGKIVRLTQADFDQWEKSFQHIDLRGALQNRDDWLIELPENDRRRSSSGWYRATSNWLTSRNEQAAAEARHDAADSDTIY